ncbi:MAG TPA: hypothetical protein VL026_09770 [Rhizomicrobium sp.]|nr:hypothetical protein [Rhizomicrobium sp.]
MSTDDLYKLAVDLASEHGVMAAEYARRACASFAAEGAHARAEFWTVLGTLLDDILAQRLDPDAPLTLH